MNSFVKENASKYGLIIGAISIVYMLIGYLVDLSLLTNTWMGIILWVVGIVLLIIAVLQTRKGMGGFISFKDAFSAFVLTYIISSLLSTVFMILLFSVIDPAAAVELQEMTIQAAVGMMEKFNAPESQIEKQVEILETTDTYGVMTQVQGFFYRIIGYAILGLIVAAIMKKNKPVFHTDEVEEN